MRDQKEWKGTLGAVLGSHKYVDFSSGAFEDSKVPVTSFNIYCNQLITDSVFVQIFDEKIDELLEMMEKLSQKKQIQILESIKCKSNKN